MNQYDQGREARTGYRNGRYQQTALSRTTQKQFNQRMTEIMIMFGIMVVLAALFGLWAWSASA